MSAGRVNVGGLVSTKVKVAVVELELSQASVAVNVADAYPVPSQSP